MVLLAIDVCIAYCACSFDQNVAIFFVVVVSGIQCLAFNNNQQSLLNKLLKLIVSLEIKM